MIADQHQETAYAYKLPVDKNKHQNQALAAEDFGGWRKENVGNRKIRYFILQ